MDAGTISAILFVLMLGLLASGIWVAAGQHGLGRKLELGADSPAAVRLDG